MKPGMKPTLTLLVSAPLVLSAASNASAQLAAAKDGPIAYGHHHLNTTNVEAQKKFFVDTLGGTAIKIGGNNTEIVKFPNVLIFFRTVPAAPGGSRRRSTRARLKDRRSTPAPPPARAPRPRGYRRSRDPAGRGRRPPVTAA